MIPVNITIQIEERENRRSRYGSIQFTKAVSVDEARAALERNGFAQAVVPDGWRRSLNQFTEHLGSRHFEFFITDEISPPPPKPEPPKAEVSP